MRRAIWIFAVAIVALILVMEANSKNKPSDEERKTLDAFQTVQSSLEGAGSSSRFHDRLGQAQRQLEMLKQSGGNPCVVGALERNLASYRMIDKVQKAKQANSDDTKTLDLDLALAVSMSFSAKNLQQAMECYK